ncbi:MAG TPA: TonB-dependent receptor plug domain-containing protein, partial [Steroidobacteraceae bacterium]
ALTEFARQAHLVVLFPYEEVSHFTANRLVGKYSIRDGLDILLKDTGLTAAVEPNRQLIVRVYAGSPRRKGFFGMLAGALSGSGDGARAQDAAEAGPAAPASQEVTITGSRLRDTGMNTPVPVTVVSSEQLDLAAPGNLIDAFDQLPQFLGSSRPGTSVFIGTDAGQSILNMRGLGENRTLVLLDGRRIVPSTAEGTIDINVLPQSLLKRVEVVTGGASAAYGTDAVAGVTNFILDTSYTGLKGRAQGGITSRGDNANKEGELTFGTAIGSQAHLIAPVDYYSSDAVETYNGRSWFQGWGTVTNPQYTATGQGPQQLVLPHVTSTLYTAGGLIRQPGSALNGLTFLADGSAVPLQLGSVYALNGTQSQSGGVGGYDYEADHAGDAGLVPDITRYNAFAHLNVDLTDDVQVYGQALFGHNNVNGRGFGSVMFGQYQATIYQDNAYLPASIRQVTVQENLPSFGFSRMGSSADLDVDRMVQSNSTTSLTAGLKSSLGDWHLNSYYQHGRNDSELQARNFPRT